MQSESVKSLAAALAAAQAEMPSVLMNAVNPFLKNHFADLGAVIETSRPVLAKHQLSMTQFPISEGDRIGVTTTLMHSSGEWISQSVTLPLSDEKGKSLAQVAGSVITYLRRYSWSSILGLYADEDTDGNRPEPRQEVTKQQRAVERKAAEMTPPEPEQGITAEQVIEALDAHIERNRQATPSPAPSNGNGHQQVERPMAAETLKSFMAAKIARYSKSAPKPAVTPVDGQIVAAKLDAIFNGQKTARYETCNWLVGKASTKEMSAAQVRALQDWLGCKDFDANPPEHAVKEAQAAHTAALKASGQNELPGVKA